MKTLVTDPVCGMEMDPQYSQGQENRGGTAYYFCSENCRERFNRNPDQFVDRRTERSPKQENL